MKKIYIALGVVLLVVIIYVISSYNGLVRSQEQVAGQWAQVEAQYQRRFDLIPNLVESVKGIMAQEEKIFGDLAAARSQYAGARTVEEKTVAANAVESSLSRLLVIMENYPTLRSSDTVVTLMSQIEGTENRISVERMRFNDAVRAFNASIKTFPRSAVAAIFNFDALTYFEADEGSQTAPRVDLKR